MYGNINGGWPGSDLGQPLGSNKAKHLTGPAVFQQEGDRSLQGVGLTWQQGHPLGAHIVYSAMDMLDVDGNDVTSLVRTGDRLMEIDGFNVTTHQTAIVEKMVVGERNSAVEMTFLSANSGMLVVLRIRRHVPPPPAQAFLDRDDEEQVRLVEEQVREHVKELQELLQCRAIDDKGTLGLRIGLNSEDRKAKPCAVTSVVPGSHAFAQGLIKEGDEIVAVDGEAVTDQNILSRVKGDNMIGSRCLLTIESNGETKRVPVQRSSASRLSEFDNVMQRCDDLYKKVAQASSDPSVSAEVDKLVAELLAMEQKNVEAESTLYNHLDAMLRGSTICDKLDLFPAAAEDTVGELVPRVASVLNGVSPPADLRAGDWNRLDSAAMSTTSGGSNKSMSVAQLLKRTKVYEQRDDQSLSGTNSQAEPSKMLLVTLRLKIEELEGTLDTTRKQRTEAQDNRDMLLDEVRVLKEQLRCQMGSPLRMPTSRRNTSTTSIGDSSVEIGGDLMYDKEPLPQNLVWRLVAAHMVARDLEELLDCLAAQPLVRSDEVIGLIKLMRGPPKLSLAQIKAALASLRRRTPTWHGCKRRTTG